MHAAKHTLADAQPSLAPTASPTPLTGFTARPRHWRTRTLGNKGSGWPRAPGLPADPATPPRKGRALTLPSRAARCWRTERGPASPPPTGCTREGTAHTETPVTRTSTGHCPRPPHHHHDDNLLPDKSRSLSEHPPLESSLELSLPPMHAHVCKLTTHLSPAGAPLLRHRSP